MIAAGCLLRLRFAAYLVDHAREGEHRQPPILELRQLQARARLLILAKLERVEAEVARRPAVLKHRRHRELPLVGGDLDPAEEGDDLQQALRRNRRDRLDGVGRVAGVGWQREELLHHVAGRRTAGAQQQRKRTKSVSRAAMNGRNKKQHLLQVLLPPPGLKASRSFRAAEKKKE